MTDTATGGRQPPRIPFITQEEKQVLKRCSDEAFWYRSVPAMLGVTFGLNALSKQGIIKPTKMVSKYIFANFFGYFGGKLSYRGACLRKIQNEIPDSNLAKSIREGKMDMIRGPMQSFDQSDKEEGEAQQSNYGDSSGNTDFDSSKVPAGLDDRYRPTVDSFQSQPDPNNSPLEQPRQALSYDGLRQQNREDYDKKNKFFGRTPYSPKTDDRPQAKYPQSPRDNQPPRGSERRNKYGDLFSLTERRNKYGDIIDDGSGS